MVDELIVIVVVCVDALADSVLLSEFELTILVVVVRVVLPYCDGAATVDDDELKGDCELLLKTEIVVSEELCKLLTVVVEL